MDVGVVVKPTAAANVDGGKSWVVAIPLVFQTGCKETNLAPDRVERLNERRATMMKQLTAFKLDAMPAEFCRAEALEDDRPLCKGTPLRDRVDNATKTLNLAKNLRNAFLTCKTSGYKLCLIMEDDTILHPDFHNEARKTLAALESEGFGMGLLHLCPQMLHRTVHPEEGDPVRARYPPPRTRHIASDTRFARRLLLFVHAVCTRVWLCCVVMAVVASHV